MVIFGFLCFDLRALDLQKLCVYPPEIGDSIMGLSWAEFSLNFEISSIRPAARASTREAS
jgi:hypothetical protein